MPIIGRPQRLTIISGDPGAETPAVRNQREKREQHEQAVAALREDETVRSLVSEFGAELKLDIGAADQTVNRTGV